MRHQALRLHPLAGERTVGISFQIVAYALIGGEHRLCIHTPIISLVLGAKPQIINVTVFRRSQPRVDSGEGIFLVPQLY